MERKYLEYFDGAFDSTVADKMKPENKPYVAYSKTEGVVYTVVPEEPTSAYQMVDLGLPSGLKWADRNVGASSPEDVGLYFQWGDTVGYTVDQIGVDKIFNWDSYFDTTDGGNTFNKYNNKGGLTILESIDDAAISHMGSQYRMPTVDEIQELIDYTTKTFIDIDGNEYDEQYLIYNSIFAEVKFKGVKFTGSNKNSIFMPTTGYCFQSLLTEVDITNGVWSASLDPRSRLENSAKYLYFSNNGDSHQATLGRNSGLPIRGVQA